MADIINLKRLRKAKLRENDEKLAAENRQKFGLSKLQKEMARFEKEQATKKLDGLKRETD
jgi:hypothetical protein